jgi:HSP20 family protein
MADKDMKTPGKPETEGRAPAARSRHPLLALRDEMDRLFDDFFAGPALTPFRRGEAEPWRRFSRMFESGFPAVDVAENEREYRITVELPGLDEKDIEIALAGDTLAVRGEKKQEREEKKESYVLSERRYGSFERSFPLPEDAEPEGIEARFRNGVLTLTLPKRPEAQAKRRTIEVKTG